VPVSGYSRYFLSHAKEPTVFTDLMLDAALAVLLFSAVAIAAASLLLLIVL
jgi:hypothetical protein